MGRSRSHDEGELCEECLERPKAKAGFYKTDDGEKHQRYKPYCNPCNRALNGPPWVKFRKDECEGCGYRPFYIGSLDVHHRDGDKSNNDPSNLETLCATCHREIHEFLRETDGDVDKADRLFVRFMNAIRR